jgi:uncharacterized protein with NRDE domain
MCLILFAYHVHPVYKLIVAANRDEYYQRPTASAHYWEDYPDILAGRDLERMGTWMGVNKNGYFAALTNYRDPSESAAGKRTRGELVTKSLTRKEHIEDYLKSISNAKEMYPGYNLLIGNKDDLYYYSNIENEVKKLQQGIYGLSNSLLNSAWPKVEKGKKELSRIIYSHNDNMIEELFTLLRSEEPFPDEMLPKTGVSLEWERLLSPLFIKSRDYGTRSSTVLLMSDHEIQYVERNYMENSFHDQTFNFSL